MIVVLDFGKSIILNADLKLLHVTMETGQFNKRNSLATSFYSFFLQAPINFFSNNRNCPRGGGG